MMAIHRPEFLAANLCFQEEWKPKVWIASEFQTPTKAASFTAIEWKICV
jgi:hypothetical protein